MINLSSASEALSSLYSEIKEHRGDLGFSDFVSRMIEDGIYNPVLKEYTQSQIIQAQTMIDRTRDQIFQIGGLVMLRDRYLIKLGAPKTWAREYPQEAFMVTALVLASTTQPSIRMEKVRDFYDAISEGKISLATPFLTNARRAGDHNSTASCFIMKVEDDLESITQAWSNAAHIASYGGGLGISLDAIRSTGASVRDIPGVSKGIASWLNVFNSIACAVDQAGSRKAAFTVSVGIHHADVLDVIQARKETEFTVGDDRKRAPELFPQVVIHDNFMETALNGGVWYMFDPAELIRYHGVDLINSNGEVYAAEYERAVELGLAGKLNTFKQEKAMLLVKEIIKCWVETGFPYIFFKSAANKHRIGSGQVYSANLCVDGGTRLLTKEGNIPIADLEGELVQAWNGEEWSLVQVTRTATEEDLIRVRLSNGVVIMATPEHKWITATGETVTTKNLKEGTVLVPTELPTDWVHKETQPGTKPEYDPSMIILLWDPENSRPQVHRFFRDASRGLVPKQDFFTVVRAIMDKSATFPEPHEFYRNSSVGLSGPPLLMKFISDSLRLYGIPNEYTYSGMGSETADLEISRNGLFRFYQVAGEYAVPSLTRSFEAVGMDIIETLSYYQDVDPSPIVVEVVMDLHVRRPVFCAHEQKRNRLVFNGQLTGNCVESFTPFDHYLIHVCNLVSLNINNIRRDHIGHYAGLAVMMLNAVVDLTNKNLLSGAQSHNRMYRAIGIGIMGLSDYFAANEIHWRDPRAAEEAESIMEDVAYHALKTSIAMGATHPARCFQDPSSTWEDGMIYGKPLEWYQENSKDPLRWETLHEKLKETKPMNCYLISVAPNTSTARLWGVSASWLPRCQLGYEYIWNNTSIPIRPPIDDDRKWFYTIDKVLDQHHKIDVAEAMQKWVDQGISLELTCNLNDGVYDTIPTRKLWDWWVHVWEAGLKSIYYISIIPVYTAEGEHDEVSPPCEGCAV